jgi:cellulose synthase/poly-beta-1,6-N-acetylglucosamine synthase-like glycosyltransferase
LNEILYLLRQADWVLLAFAVLIFEVPRYTLSLLSLAVLCASHALPRGEDARDASVSVIIPAFNGASGLQRTIDSLCRQTLTPVEIIVVDDGSTDETYALAERARAAGLIDVIIHHGTRCGRSPAVNAGARFAQGGLLLAVDPDTVLAPNALARLVAAFEDPKVAAACCNLRVSNADESLWSELQSLEYLMSISAGKSFLTLIDAISCCSGACSLYRRDVFLERGGFDVGPGEDLEFTLRLRRFGYRVRFVPEAWAETAVPETAVGLIKQRLRWDRDALRIRLIQYGEGRPFRYESLSDTLQRLDFIVFDLMPTLSFPFYLAYCVLLFGAHTLLFLAGVYS